MYLDEDTATATQRTALIRVNTNVVQQMYTVYTVTADTAETRKVAVGQIAEKGHCSSDPEDRATS